ncbi:MAG: hypothetical protein Q8P28_00425 [Deltaproteobacteria bacterium]|nr:hypothetical protein [Deltaproteobacteria bacterium]
MNKSIIHLILVVLLAVFISPTASLSKDNKSSPRAILDDLQKGFWLNKAYLTQLLKTKSPQKAQVNIHESGFWVKKEDDKYPVLVGFDFHDSGTSFTITGIRKTSTKGVYELVTTPEPYSNIKQQRVTLMKRKSGDEIQWKFTSNNMDFPRI